MKNKIYAIGIAAFVLLWFTLAGFSWFGPDKDKSIAERRNLEQAPKLSMETILAKDEKRPDGSIAVRNSFMSKFEKYTLDQFPLRDTFRQMKSVYQYNIMQQKDNNGYYLVGDYAAEVLYPLDETSLNRNIAVMNTVYDRYLKDLRIQTYVTVIPDKGYYVAEKNGYLALDYEKMFGTIRENMDENVTHIDITDTLNLKSYYHTDTHWRQEKILPTASKIAEAMGKTVEAQEAFEKTVVNKPFYGAYHGFAALPLKADRMYLMRSELLEGCTVKYLNDKGEMVAMDMYDMTMENDNDLYNIFFTQNQAKVEITNPKGARNKELVVFGDSFSRSMVPLLVKEYSKVTLIDLRNYTLSDVDKRLFLPGKTDVLFLYSTLVLNASIVK